MTRFLSTLLALLVFAATSIAQQAAPQLGSYVNEQGKDALVVLYGDKALELADCTTDAMARTLLSLPADSAPVQTTLTALQSDFGFGQWPKLSCDPAKFDAYWPPSTPIWADLEDTGNYFIAAASGGGYFALPSACTPLKTAIAIRQRLQLPRVLQGLTAPADLTEPRLVIGCGKTGSSTDAPGTSTASSNGGWSLHRFETFLTPESTRDNVYVARFIPPGADAKPSYLPIIRVDGKQTSDVILQAGDDASKMEAALRRLFGIAPDAALTQLGGEAVGQVRLAPYVDLCLENCANYVHVHAGFLNPVEDLGVSQLATPMVSSSLDPLGVEQISWPFADGRNVTLIGCQRLASAIGIAAPISADWFAATSPTPASGSSMTAKFSCLPSQAGSCTRRVELGGVLTLAVLSPGTDCATAEQLRVELPAAVKAPQGLLLDNPGFKSIVFLPQAGVARSAVTIVPSKLTPQSATCVLSQANALIVANRLPRLELHNIDLLRATGDSAEVLALQVEGGTLVLDNVTIGADAPDTAPVSRGVNLCVADLYAAEAQIKAESIAIQALSAKVMISGNQATRAPAILAKARYAMVLSSGSAARLNLVDITTANPIVLRGAVLEGVSTTLKPASTGLIEGSGLMLERNSSARLLTSSISGFRCAASFADERSRVELRLPGNDITADNANRTCGPGTLAVIE